MTMDTGQVLIYEIAPEEVLSYVGQLELVYCSAFGAAPWHESARQARRFVLRLLDQTASRDFHLVVASMANRLVGFGYGRVAVSHDEPIQDFYPELIECVGPKLSESALFEAFEVTELAVASSWQGHGIGAKLHDSLLDLSHCKKAWLLTHEGATNALALYGSRGWVPLSDFGLAPGTRRTAMTLSLRDRPR